MEPCDHSEPSAEKSGATMNPETSSSPFPPFKSKKIIQSFSKSSTSSSSGASDPNTPEKPTQVRQRLRNRGAALSVKEVRKAAEELRKSNQQQPLDRPNPIKSGKPAAKKTGFRSSSDPSMKPTSGSIQLPAKYEILAKFYDSMESSIRLLRMKGKPRTFTNISRGIESLTDRRFSYNHLAQLKYILPEVIAVEKVLTRDERTLCMKPDLQVTLEVDAVENNLEEKQGSGYSNLRKVFRSRLLEFVKSHPEVDDIPEETLPEPFNQSKQTVTSSACETTIPAVTVRSSSSVFTQQNRVAASHLSQSFERRFVGKVPLHESEKSQLLSTNSQPPSSAFVISEESSSCKRSASSAVLSPFKPSSKLPIIRVASPSDDAFPVKPCPPNSIGAVDETTKPEEKKNCILIENDEHEPKGTPAKFLSTPMRLMTATPDLQTPKRCRVSQEDDTTASPTKLLRRPPRNRPLFHTPVKNKKAEDEMSDLGRSSTDADIVKLLPESLLQSIREKEKKAIEERDIGISLAKRRRQMIACLPKLFNMIHLIFQSANRRVLSKEELIHKTISNHCDIVDRNEIEEQLKLLLELVPNWISEKVAFSGDLLLSINKPYCPDTIRRTLAEAL